VAGTAVTLSATATDTQDGDLTGSIAWSSSIAGPLGTGGSLSGVLMTGTHVITAAVTDSGGLTASRQVTVTVSDPTVTQSSSSPSLQARGYKVKGGKSADLSWTGVSDASVQILRNKAVIATTANDGAQTDSIGGKGAGTYQYQVCGTASGTCSNVATVTF